MESKAATHPSPSARLGLPSSQGGAGAAGLSHPGRWAGPVVIAVALGAALVWSWNRWADPLVDFGQQLYVAWRLAEGETLHIDVSDYYGGPLSPYLNAAWFRLFGVGILTLVAANIAVLALILSLLYHLLVSIGDRVSATAACLTFIGVFAVAQYGVIGGFNYVCPYTHDITHGILLALAALVLLERYLRSLRCAWLAASGAALGLTLLCKPEIALAAAAALSFGVAAALAFQIGSLRRIASHASSFVAGVVAPPLLAAGVLTQRMTLAGALAAVAGPWPLIARGNVAALSLYSWGLGSSDIAANLATIATWSLVFGLAAGALTVVSLALRRRSPHTLAAAAGAAAVFTWTTLHLRGGLSAADAFRPLPVLMLALAAVFAVDLWKRRRSGLPACRRRLLQLTVALFAFLLLGKILLNARIYHYGFVLAMPATMLAIVAITGWGSRLVHRFGGSGRVVRVAGIVCCLLLSASHLRLTDQFLRQKIYRVGRAGDLLLADSRGRLVQSMLAEIERRVLPEDSLAVFPEGAMINYLTRRKIPTRYVNFLPIEMAVFGELRILEALRASPPDYVALVHRPTPEHGFELFGRDYGEVLGTWIRENYRSEVLAGAPPLRDGRFGIELLRRVTAPPVERSSQPQSGRGNPSRLSGRTPP